MMKYIFAVMLTMLSIAAAQAQRMMPQQNGLELNAGLLSKGIKDNYYLNLTLTVNGKNGSYWIWGAEYTHQFSGYREIPIPLETYTGEIGYSLQLLGDARKTFTVNAGLTAVGGYETINLFVRPICAAPARSYQSIMGYGFKTVSPIRRRWAKV